MTTEPATATFLAVKFKRLAVSAGHRPPVTSRGHRASQTKPATSKNFGAKTSSSKCGKASSQKSTKLVLRSSKLSALIRGTVNSEENIFGTAAAVCSGSLENFAQKAAVETNKSVGSSFSGDAFTDLSVICILFRGV